MKDILLLSPFFYPEPISTGKYNAVVAKELSVEVDGVDVLCAHPIYPKWKVEPTEKQLDGVNAIRGGRWLKFPRNVLLRRAVLELWFFFYVLFKMYSSKKKYSHIVAIFPPSLFMMIVPMLSKHSKIVGIVHDLQGVYAKQNSGLVKRIIFGAIKKVEAHAFSCCDKLIFLSEDMKESARVGYSLKNECVVHYPFVTINAFENSGNLKDIIPDGEISLVYSGALGDKQAPELLAQFMEEFVSENPSVIAHIFSQGPIFENLKSSYPKINFHGLVDESDLPELLMRSTIQILPQTTGTSDGSLPSKLPNLLASKCKILCITDAGSELVRILEVYTQSAVSNNWDMSELKKLAAELLKVRCIESDDSKLLNMFKKESLVTTIIGEE
jgi:glycosyltransferase involved in cell wall biosynthesis